MLQDRDRDLRSLRQRQVDALDDVLDLRWQPNAQNEPPNSQVSLDQGSRVWQFCTQSDTMAAFAASLLALMAGVLIMLVGRPTKACAFGYPPWGNLSVGSIECDGALCHKQESARFQEYFNAQTGTYNTSAIADKLAQEARGDSALADDDDAAAKQTGVYPWVQLPACGRAAGVGQCSSEQQRARRLAVAVRWVCYGSHQLSVLMCVFAAQKKRDSIAQEEKYVGHLRPVNVWLFVVNACFLVMQALNSHFYFDGLAAEMSFSSAQIGLLLLVCVILVLQLEHRGLVLGRKIRFLDGATYLLRRYHGYVLAYLAVQQLWFHPWVATSAHAVGLAHSLLLLAQSSLIHTKMHLNPYWCLLLEAFILLHALPLRESPYGYLALYPPHAYLIRYVCLALYPPHAYLIRYVCFA
jgi:hypothetical protein